MIKKQVAVIAFTLWLVIISLSMLLTGRFDVALFFVLGFIGFLVIVIFIEPRYVKPGYLRYLRYLTAAGIVLFGTIIVLKLLEIFSQ